MVTGADISFSLFVFFSSTQINQTPPVLLPLNVIPLSLLLPLWFFFLSLMPQSQFVSFFLSYLPALIPPSPPPSHSFSLLIKCSLSPFPLQICSLPLLPSIPP